MGAVAGSLETLTLSVTCYNITLRLVCRTDANDSWATANPVEVGRQNVRTVFSQLGDGCLDSQVGEFSSGAAS